MSPIVFNYVELTQVDSGNDPQTIYQWDMCSQQISQQIIHIFWEIRNILLLDPNKTFFQVDSNGSREKEIPLFRTWKSAYPLQRHSLFRGTSSCTFFDAVYSAAGIKLGEFRPQGPSDIVNLSDFHVSTILQGVFRVALTNDPSLHLRIVELDGKRPTLFILDTRTALMLGFFDLTGFTR